MIGQCQKHLQQRAFKTATRSKYGDMCGGEFVQNSFQILYIEKSRNVIIRFGILRTFEISLAFSDGGSPYGHKASLFSGFNYLRLNEERFWSHSMNHVAKPLQGLVCIHSKYRVFVGQIYQNVVNGNIHSLRSGKNG